MNARELEARLAELEELAEELDVIQLRGRIAYWELEQLMADEEVDSG